MLHTAIQDRQMGTGCPPSRLIWASALPRSTCRTLGMAHLLSRCMPHDVGLLDALPTQMGKDTQTAGGLAWVPPKVNFRHGLCQFPPPSSPDPQSQARPADVTRYERGNRCLRAMTWWAAPVFTHLGNAKRQCHLQLQIFLHRVVRHGAADVVLENPHCVCRATRKGVEGRFTPPKGRQI